VGAGPACFRRGEHAGQKSKPQPKPADTTPPHINQYDRNIPTTTNSVQAAHGTHCHGSNGALTAIQVHESTTIVDSCP
jgi:hypothetical protein